VFHKVDEIFREYRCTKIFIGTEDKIIYQQFKNKYGDCVVTNRKRFIHYGGEKSIGKWILDNVEDLKEEGMEYLITILILCRCNCFIGGLTSGTVGVMLLHDEFEYKYIFDLGLYS